MNKKIDQSLIRMINDIKRNTKAEAMVMEADEIDAGKTVIDEPVAVMKTWFVIASLVLLVAEMIIARWGMGAGVPAPGAA